MKEILFLYICIVGFISFVITIYDKRNAKKGKRRISEKTLLTYAAIGGAGVMYITMLLIRHKTKHIKFMLFLPLIIIVHTVLLYYVLNYI